MSQIYKENDPVLKVQEFLHKNAMDAQIGGDTEGYCDLKKALIMLESDEDNRFDSVVLYLLKHNWYFGNSKTYRILEDACNLYLKYRREEKQKETKDLQIID